MAKYMKLGSVAKDALEKMAKGAKRAKLAPDERAVILDEIDFLQQKLKKADKKAARTIKKQIRSLRNDLKGLVEGDYE